MASVMEVAPSPLNLNPAVIDLHRQSFRAGESSRPSGLYPVEVAFPQTTEAGRRHPHPLHWQALAQLVGSERIATGGPLQAHQGLAVSRTETRNSIAKT